MMVQVIRGGHAIKAGVEGYYLAGKNWYSSGSVSRWLW